MKQPLNTSLLLPQITLLDQQLREVSRRIGQILAKLTKADAENDASLRDASLMLSIPGIGSTVASTLLTAKGKQLACGTPVVPASVKLFMLGIDQHQLRFQKSPTIRQLASFRPLPIAHEPYAVWPIGYSDAHLDSERAHALRPFAASRQPYVISESFRQTHEYRGSGNGYHTKSMGN